MDEELTLLLVRDRQTVILQLSLVESEIVRVALHREQHCVLLSLLLFLQAPLVLFEEVSREQYCDEYFFD